MPYRGRQEIEFPQHETQNVMLLFGDNMRGKTSFLNAVRWGFYGVALGRHLREITRANLINRDAVDESDWTMSVTLYFVHDSKNYVLDRKITGRENTIRPQNNADFVEIIGLKVDDVVIPGDAINNTINQVMPREVSRFFLFDGELLQEYENLVIEESDQGKKIKEHIESILGVPALVHARDELKDLLNEARKTQRKDAAKNDELRKFAKDQKDLEDAQETFEDDIRNLQSQKDEIQGKIDNIDNDLKNTAAIQNKKIELARLDGEKNNFEDQIRQSTEKIHVLIREAWKDVLASSVRSIIEKLKEERRKQQRQVNELIDLQGKINELRKSIEEQKVCSTCGQEIPENTRRALEEKLKGLLLSQSEKGVYSDQKKLSELETTIENLEGIRSSSEVDRIIDCIRNITRTKNELMDTENRRDNIWEEIKDHDTEEIMRKREKRDQLQKLLTNIETDLNDVNRKKDEITEKRAKISRLISKHKGSEGSLSNKRVKRLEQLGYVFEKGIDRLRQKLKDDVETRSTKTFKQLTTEGTYSGLKINSSYGLSILDQGGRVLDERSAGAEQVVALSLIDGLNKTSGTKAPIVMDTPLGRLDLKHRKNILQYLPDMSEQIVLLIHEGEINANRDIEFFATRIGARYEIKRISATHSRIERMS